MVKRYNQAKKHAKANILFLLRDMSMTCEHVHRQELWKYFKFWVAVAK